MKYTIITPIEMTEAAAAVPVASNSDFPWRLLALLIIAIITLTVIATREYEKNQASPTVA